MSFTGNRDGQSHLRRFFGTRGQDAAKSPVKPPVLHAIPVGRGPATAAAQH